MAADTVLKISLRFAKNILLYEQRRKKRLAGRFIYLPVVYLLALWAGKSLQYS